MRNSIKNLMNHWDNPTIECGMIHFNAPLSHIFFKITIRNAISDIEKYSVENDIFWKVDAFKTDHRIFQLLKLVNCR